MLSVEIPPQFNSNFRASILRKHELGDTTLGAPIAIFGFNRPENLRRLFENLRSCAGFSDSKIYVFVDGPRSAVDVPLVEEVRKVVLSYSAVDWILSFSDHNKGCRAAIAEGITKVCHENDRVIVIEDDLRLSSKALDYFNEGLDRYVNDARVWSICGYGFRSKALEQENRAFFMPYAHPWGWATWSRAWLKFDIAQPALDRQLIKSSTFRKLFNIGGLVNATDLLELEMLGKVSCWDVRWYWKIFSSGGVSLFPTQNYVENLGVRSGGTHASGLNPYGLIMQSGFALNESLPIYPNDVSSDYGAIDAMRDGLDARVSRIVAKLGRWRRLLNLRSGGPLA